MYKEIQRLIRAIQDNSSILIATHKLADIDALASAITISRVIRNLGKNVEIYTPEGLLKPAKELAERYGFKTRILLNTKDFYDFNPTLLILVDVGSIDRSGENILEYMKRKKPLVIIIDHHRVAVTENMLSIPILKIEHTEASSTSEILAEMLGNASLLDQVSACMLILGILADTGNLRNASCQTLAVLSKLCRRCNQDFRELRRLLQKTRIEYSEAIARLKGAQRMRLLKLGELIVAITRVDAYQSSVAQALLSLGADLSIVLGRSGKKTIGNLRLSSSAQKLGMLDLRDIASKLAGRLGGSGGGHQAAAAFQIPKDMGLVVDTLLSILQDTSGQRITELA